MAKAVSYSKLENTLGKLDAQLTVAETHGLLTGMLSLAQPIKDDVWREALIENLDCNTPTKGQWNVLLDLSNEIKDQLNATDFEFNVLLPKDNEPLAERLDALGYWCRGYLSGLGLVGVTQEQLSKDVTKELVQDLSQIAHISVETDDSDEDEHNYMELVEYVRVAVQNIQIELQTNSGSKQLH